MLFSYLPHGMLAVGVDTDSSESQQIGHSMVVVDVQKEPCMMGNGVS